MFRLESNLFRISTDSGSRRVVFSSSQVHLCLGFPLTLSIDVSVCISFLHSQLLPMPCFIWIR